MSYKVDRNGIEVCAGDIVKYGNELYMIIRSEFGLKQCVISSVFPDENGNTHSYWVRYSDFEVMVDDPSRFIKSIPI